MALDSVNARKYGISLPWGAPGDTWLQVGAIAHPGVDIGAVYAPIFCEFPGTVSETVYGHPGYGNYVEVTDLDGDKWIYAHLSSIQCVVGQDVKRGQVMAISGSTGMSTGPHLHLEVFPSWGGDARYYGTSDPIRYLAAETRDIEEVNTQGEPPMTVDEERNAYRIVLGREMEHTGSGRTGYEFITGAAGEVVANRTNTQNTISSLQAALTNAQNKPAEVIVKEVEKIVTEYIDRPVEVIKEVEKPFTDEDGKNWLFNLIRKLLKRS